MRRPGQKRAPVEGEPQEHLRPPGEPLGERDRPRPAPATATPSAIAAALKVSRMHEGEQRLRHHPDQRLLRTLTCPDGIGRDRGARHRPSMSRSVMSFQVQPAPRISNAPIAQPDARSRDRSSRAGPSMQHRQQQPPPAGQQQQPGADRPVRAAQPQIGPGPGRAPAGRPSCPAPHRPPVRGSGVWSVPVIWSAPWRHEDQALCRSPAWARGNRFL